MVGLVVNGFLLGWSVAWPPGPINAEMIRRGLVRGFFPAWLVGLGACTGDAVWAFAVALGAGALTRLPGVTLVLGAVSVLLLIALAWLFLRGAFRGWAAVRRGEPLPQPKTLESARGGYLLGLTMALSSPWNVAFWLAVIGQQGAGLSFSSSLIVAGAVIAGAVTWTLLLCSAVRLGARFATPAWQIATQGLTGLLMLAFAVRGVVRLAGG